MNGSEKITELIESKFAQPRRLTLNLALPFTDREFDIGGTMLGIWDSPGAADTIQVRFNEQSAAQIPMKRQKVIATPFNKVFITVPPGLAGNMEILYGSGGMENFRMYPNVAEQAGAIDQIRDELTGDMVHENYGQVAIGLAFVLVLTANANRKDAIVQAKLGNAGIVYLGFDNTVAANNCFVELESGDAWSFDDYRGDVYAIASAAAQNVNYGEW